MVQCKCGRVGGGETYVFEIVGGANDSAEAPIYAHDEADATECAERYRVLVGGVGMRLLGTRAQVRKSKLEELVAGGYTRREASALVREMM